MGTKADDLIAARQEQSRPKVPPMSKEARAEVEKVLAYNDGVTRMARVSAAALREMLKESYGWDHGHGTLNRYCQEVLGRKGWAEP